MGVKISKRYSIYSSKVFATKFFLQTPDGGPHRMFYFEILSLKKLLKIALYSMGNSNGP